MGYKGVCCVLPFAYNINANGQHTLRHMPFYFEAKYGLLTYAQCGELDPHEVVCHLGDLGAECIIGRENHDDGGIHLHAFFMFGRKFRSRNERVFDVGGRHPNIVRGYGTPEKGWDYATKDGDVVGGGLGRPGGDGVSEAGNVWAQLVLAPSREEFFDMCARLAPRALLCNFTSLRCYADWKYRDDPVEYRHPDGLLFRPDLDSRLNSWVQQNLGGCRDSGKCCHARRYGEASCSLRSPGLRASVGLTFARGRPIYKETRGFL